MGFDRPFSVRDMGSGRTEGQGTMGFPEALIPFTA